MHAAVRLARRGLGLVWPNPSVGALIVLGDSAGTSRVCGRGVTSLPGSAHAEVNALRQAGSLARGATCYVTLEPCSHFGRTPPCANALIEAGVKRVVVGMLDPNPRVRGRGIAMLEDAGVEVTVGVAQEACKRLHHGFASRIERMEPEVTLKMAVSQDGAIGREGGGQVKISGALAKTYVHGLRASHDAILIGIGTALADDPELTCRLPGMEDRSPVRIVIDSEARLPLSSKLVREAARVPVWVICSNEASTENLQALSDAGVKPIRVPLEDGAIAPHVALKALGTRGVTRLLLEGGRRIASAFLRADAVDEICLIKGALTIGEGAITAFDDRTVDDVLADPAFERVETGVMGPDLLTRLRKKPLSLS